MFDWNRHFGLNLRLINHLTWLDQIKPRLMCLGLWQPPLQTGPKPKTDKWLNNVQHKPFLTLANREWRPSNRPIRFDLTIWAHPYRDSYLFQTNFPQFLRSLFIIRIRHILQWLIYRLTTPCQKFATRWNQTLHLSRFLFAKPFLKKGYNFKFVDAPFSAFWLKLLSHPWVFSYVFIVSKLILPRFELRSLGIANQIAFKLKMHNQNFPTLAFSFFRFVTYPAFVLFSQSWENKFVRSGPNLFNN